MTASWRLVALLGATAGLVICHQSGRAVPVPDASAAPDVPPAREAAPKPARFSLQRCARLRQSVKRQLAAAQRCKRDDTCEAIAFEYTFQPCGTSVRAGATLTKVAADARLYQERCNPVLRPVRCLNLPRAVCDRGRCTLAAPEKK